MASSKLKSSKNQFKLEEGVVDYFDRVSQTLLSGFSTDDDEKAIFLDNVFEQLESDALRVCRCPKSSSCIEDLIEAASLLHIIKVLRVLFTEWQALCEDRSACHVLERLVSVLPKYIRKPISDSDIMKTVKKSEIDSEDSCDDIKILTILLAVSDLALDNLETNLTHVYASHVLRMLLQVLGGSCVGETVLKSRTSRRRDKEVSVEKKRADCPVKFTDYSVPPLFMKKLKSFAKKIFRLDDFGVLLTDPNASPVIQTLLLVLHKNDLELCQKYIHKVIKSSRIKNVEKSDNPELMKLPPVLLDSVGSFLMEQVLTLTSPHTFSELYEELFKGRLLQFAAHPKANFVLQRLIGSCKEKEMFESIFDEVSEYLEDVLAACHFGIAVSLAERCHKLGTRQDKYRELLMRAFHCYEPVKRQIKFALLLASLSTYEIYYQLTEDSQDNMEEKTPADIPILSKFNYHGTLLLQHLLQFSNPKSLVTGVLDLKPAELRNMSCDPCGSHVIDTFFMADIVGEKNKDTVLKKLQGLYVELTCHRNGSRTLESIWRHLNIKQKTLVATEICEQEAKVRSDTFGWHIHRNFALGHFVKRKNDWIGIQGAKNRKREMFKDILEQSEGGAGPIKSPKQSFEPGKQARREHSPGKLKLQEAEELSKSSKQRTTYTGETTVQKRTKISEINKPFRNKDKKLKPRDFIRMRKERKKQAANT